jgi:threonine/homoserine/homoserine lactone efflux protein
MCDGKTITAFVVASAAIILAPGPAQALVLARTLEQGRRAGLTTALGLNAATLVHALAAALGLSALLATSAAAFTVVKLAGVSSSWPPGRRAGCAPGVLTPGGRG